VLLGLALSGENNARLANAVLRTHGKRIHEEGVRPLRLYVLATSTHSQPHRLSSRHEGYTRVDMIHEQIVPPKTGFAIEVPKGNYFRVTDVEGKQCVDMAVFNLHNFGERLSTSYSRTRFIPSRHVGEAPEVRDAYLPKDYLTEGDFLLSTLCNPMMKITKETPSPKGVHKVHGGSCNRLFYENHGLGPKEGCQEAISKAVEPYGIQPEDIPDTIDLFMNMHHDCSLRQWVIEEPVSQPGDYMEFRAEMDCLVALSNCPEDTLTPANGYHCTPIMVSLYRQGS
jgi:uncharacterized protein YcgI (DUF1989 family)